MIGSGAIDHPHKQCGRLTRHAVAQDRAKRKDDAASCEGVSGNLFRREVEARRGRQDLGPRLERSRHARVSEDRPTRAVEVDRLGRQLPRSQPMSAERLDRRGNRLYDPDCVARPQRRVVEHLRKGRSGAELGDQARTRRGLVAHADQMRVADRRAHAGGGNDPIAAGVGRAAPSNDAGWPIRHVHLTQRGTGPPAFAPDT